MTTYKRNLIVWAQWFGIEMIFGFAGIYVSSWFIVLVVGGIIVGSMYLRKVRCSGCGAAINLQMITLYGIPIFNPGPFRTTCGHCGANLKEQAVSVN